MGGESHETLKDFFSHLNQTKQNKMKPISTQHYSWISGDKQKRGIYSDINSPPHAEIQERERDVIWSMGFWTEARRYTFLATSNRIHYTHRRQQQQHINKTSVSLTHSRTQCHHHPSTKMKEEKNEDVHIFMDLLHDARHHSINKTEDTSKINIHDNVR